MLIQQLVPPPPHDAPLTAVEALADPPSASNRPAVRVCMVQSIDGVVAIDGTSGALGGVADREFFLACRSLADIVLVGAQTVRAEGYGPARLTPQLVVARQGRGQPTHPSIAIVSRSLNLDFTSPLFTEPRAPTTVITCEAVDSDRRSAAEDAANVIVAGDESVDLALAVGALGSDGCRLISCEGGPTLNAHLFSAGLVDELCLSIAPVVVGDGPRFVTPPIEHGALTLHRLIRADDYLFARFRPVT